MNEIKTKLKSVIETVNRYNDNVLSYAEEKKAILNNFHLTQDGKETKLNDLRRMFEEKIKDVYSNVKEALSDIKNSVIEINSKSLDFTDEKLIKCIEFINAVKQNLTAELLNDIVKQFIGNRKALLLVKSAISSYKPNIDLKIFDKYTEDIEPKFKYIDNAMYFATADYNNSAREIKNSLNTLYEIAEILGIEIEPNEENKE